jgi:mono/diheme cytochrome c family protein
MRTLTFHLFVALLLFGGVQRSFAQDIENGRWLSERWCSQCHDVGSAPDKFHKAPSFETIAAKQTIDAEKIASLVTHAPMPNPPLTPLGVRDIAQYINEMKK